MMLRILHATGATFVLYVLVTLLAMVAGGVSPRQLRRNWRVRPMDERRALRKFITILFVVSACCAYALLTLLHQGEQPLSASSLWYRPADVWRVVMIASAQR